MNWILNQFVSRLVTRGNLRITFADGTTASYGDGTGNPVHVRIASKAAERALVLDPELAVAETYMNGDLVFHEGDVLDLLRVLFSASEDGKDAFGGVLNWIEKARFLTRRFQQFNTRGRARNNVRRHYDLSGELYRLFLDPDMQYSCAYFEEPGMSLEDAQLAKKRHIAAKLQPRPGQKVLDIGCGWGGLGLYLARTFDAEVTGVTLSEEQHAVANRRARDERLTDRVRFELQDYRNVDGPFDRIVSVGMFEHVGVNHYRTFFDRCARLLKRDGVMLLHSIGRSDGPGVTSAFIRKYIFPGGYIPALSEVIPAIERSGLRIRDIEILHLHYAETLRHWRERFLANRDKAAAIYDDRFVRMWDFYLAASEASFRWSNMMVFQIQLAHTRDAVPLTRDYIGETEKRLRALAPGAGFREAAE